MGAAAHRSGGQLRLVVSAIAAAAALYGAVVQLALGPPSPLALGEVTDPPPQVVPLRVHDRAAPRPVRSGPQPSPGPARHHARTPTRSTHAVQEPQPKEQPTSTRDTGTPVAVASATQLFSVPTVELPTLPALDVPAIPALPVSIR